MRQWRKQFTSLAHKSQDESNMECFWYNYTIINCLLTIFVHKYYAQSIYYTDVSKCCESLTDWSIPLKGNISVLEWRQRLSFIWCYFLNIIEFTAWKSRPVSKQAWLAISLKSGQLTVISFKLTMPATSFLFKSIYIILTMPAPSFLFKLIYIIYIQRFTSVHHKTKICIWVILIYIIYISIY